VNAQLKYITQIDAKTLKEISATVNPTPGNGIRIERNDQTVKIEIDQQALKLMMWAFYHNGGPNSTLANLENVSLDPAG